MKSEKRTPIITISHYGALYGANRSLLTLILASKERIDWLVICKSHGDFVTELATNGIPYRVISFTLDAHKLNNQTPLNKVKAVLNLARNLVIIPYLFILIRKHNPVAIHSNSSVFVLGAVLAYILRLPHLWHIREIPDLQYNLIYSFGENWFKFWAGKARRLICVSMYVKDMRITDPNFASKALVLYNGIGVNSIYNQQVKNDYFQLVIAGVINKSKNQLIAIKAVHLLTQAGMKVHLRVVGGGYTNDTYYHEVCSYIIENNLSDNVELTGYKINVDEIFSGAQVSLMCSSFEAMGRVTVESMLRGIPVIAHNSGGTSEIITHNEDGILYTGSHEALAKEIQALALDSQKLKSLADHARIRAKAKFSVEQYRDKFLEIIEEL